MHVCEVPGTFMELGTEVLKGVTLWVTFKKYYELMVKKITFIFFFLNREARFWGKHPNPIKILQNILNP